MDDTIITIYCLCEEFLEAIGHRDDPQVRLSTAEVMTMPLVSAAFFSGNIDKTRLFLHEYGYMKEMISKSRLNHRPHAIGVPYSGRGCSPCWPNSSSSATSNVRSGLPAGGGVRQHP
jgi:hypothetical protein